MKTYIDLQKCIGCMLCTTLCPDIYEMQADKAVVKVGIVQAEAQTCVRNAVSQCPVEAITVAE